MLGASRDKIERRIPYVQQCSGGGGGTRAYYVREPGSGLRLGVGKERQRGKKGRKTIKGMEATYRQKSRANGFHLLKRRFPLEAAAFAPPPLAKVPEFPEVPGVPEKPSASRSQEIADASSPGDCVVHWFVGRGV